MIIWGDKVVNSEARQILEAVKAGSMSIDDALLEIKKEPFEDIGYAKVDLHRKIRQGAAEVIYGAGKTPEQMIGIVSAMLKCKSWHYWRNAKTNWKGKDCCGDRRNI